MPYLTSRGGVRVITTDPSSRGMEISDEEAATMRYYGVQDSPADLKRLNDEQQKQQQEANAGRIPLGSELQQSLSSDIAGLLNPPAMFPDTNRHSAELEAGRGIGGSAAGYGTGLRMTEEERLKRIALGSSLLSASQASNPAAPLINPLGYMSLQFQQQQAAIENSRRARVSSAPRFSSTGPQPSVPVTNSPFLGGSENYTWSGSTAGTGEGNTTPWSPSNDSGSATGVSGLDQMLIDLGLTPPDYNPGQTGTGYTSIGALPGSDDYYE